MALRRPSWAVRPCAHALFLLSGVAFASACSPSPTQAPGDADHSDAPGEEPHHAAHGHAVVVEEHSDGMLERIEDEDTAWVELPDFGECPYEEGDVPPYKKPDDKHVPAYDPKKTRIANLEAGNEKIHNEALLQLLNNATAQVLNCVSMSCCYDERALGSGAIELEFEISPKGKVLGVNVEPTAALDHSGVRECARLAIWDTQFPAYDGADMVVSYSLDID